ncbi:MAG: DctP family TRAP transporter solute-binding subunit [Burkholderiaceae bacterium]
MTGVVQIQLRRTLALLLLAGATACAWPSGVHAQLLIRFSHVVARDTPKGLAVERFKQLVEQRSAGHIQVTVYPGARMYGDLDEMEALRLGAVEMLAPSLSKFGRVGFPEFELFDLPFLFEQLQDVRQITQGPIGQRLLASLGRQGMVGLGFFDNGFKQMSANRPLLAPADFQGLRMRIQSSRVIAAQFQALGARPVVLGFSEARRALATHVVDGTENPVSNFWTQRMDEVQTDLSLTNHGYLGYAVVANQRFWSSLQESDRVLVANAMRDALAFGNTIADAENDRSLQALRGAGTTRIHVLSAQQRALLRAAVQPVYDQLSVRIGAHWLRDVQQALGAVKH